MKRIYYVETLYFGSNHGTYFGTGDFESEPIKTLKEAKKCMKEQVLYTLELFYEKYGLYEVSITNYGHKIRIEAGGDLCEIYIEKE